ncbi:patatin-like phospholipase family protein [Variovorax sp. Sphag1AA]|uniref:patatin-like phospholipase family protein n=1 Tax=Variovorax sp. Sphag1AA TaxID=2587027 RepID=UPI00161A8C2E|nr:patatin-like phospholipase family protein [Variovorax sp. Sphag1AA]MBB3182444.1 NTE family protein [Variovorax sp. Sphag1AA]
MAAALIAGCGSLHETKAAEAASVRTLEEVRGDTLRKAKAPSSRPVVGLALGGGGLRGYAHVGVLQALDEAGIDIEVVAGTSVGAVIGALYSSGKSPAEIRNLAENLDVASLTDWHISSASFMRGDALTRWVSSMTRPIESMPRRFGAVAAAIDSGEPLLLDGGDAGMAVRASAAVPGAMQPVDSPHGPLVDGGISSLVPVRFARALGADVVIGVDIYCNSPRASGMSFLTTLTKVAQTQTCLVSHAETAEADVVIAPSISVKDMKSITQRDDAILAGYTMARAAIPTILDLLDGRGTGKSESTALQ